MRLINKKLCVLVLCVITICVCCLLVACNDEEEVQTFSVKYYVGNELYYEGTYTLGEELVFPADPVLYQHRFDGWYIDKEFKLPYKNEYAGNIKLFAKMDLFVSGYHYDSGDTVITLEELEEANALKIEDNVLVKADFSAYEEGKFLLGEETNVTEIGDSAFENQDKLTMFDTMCKITKIGDRAFYDCILLSYVEISKELKSIGDYAFYDTKIKEINLPTNLTQLGKGAFASSFLKEITIPAGITKIDDKCFRDCKHLTKIELSKTVKEIGNYAFAGAAINSINLPDSVTTIGDAAFYKCYELTDVVVSYKCELSSGTFFQCEALKNVDISNVTNIESETFHACTAIESIKMPLLDDFITNKRSLAYVFGSVPTSLKEVTLTSGNSIYKELLQNCSSIERITIPNSVTKVDQGSLKGCSSLKYVSLPFVGEKRYGSSDFNKYSLGYIFGDTQYEGSKKCKQYYKAGAFTSTIEYYLPSSLEEVVVTDCTNIPLGAFSRCSMLKRVTLPNTVRSIDEKIFTECPALEYLSVPFIGAKRYKTTDENQYPLGYFFGSYTATQEYSLFIQEYKTTSSKTKQETYVMPRSLKEVVITDCDYLQYGALMNCNSMDITLPKTGLKTIGTKSIGIQTITELVIPDGVTVIQANAFYNCINLESITIPSSVTSIAHAAFETCDKLTTINYKGTQEQWKKCSTTNWNDNSKITSVICSDGTITIN